MAIDKDRVHQTAISIDYTRTGNTLHRRERHGVKDTANVVHVTFDETSSYKGDRAIEYYEEIKATRDVAENSLTITESRHADIEEEMQSDLGFINAQITEIEGLMP